MSIVKELDELYMLLCRKYPKINAKPNENLNIEANTARILKKLWYNVREYHTVQDIAIVVGLKDRQVYRWADKYRWPKRSEIKKEKRLKKAI